MSFATFLQARTSRGSLQLSCDTIFTATDASEFLKGKNKRKGFAIEISCCRRIKPCLSLRDVPSLPRLGMSLVLKEAFHNIQYEGRGPGENYPDRKAGCHVGLYTTTPSGMAYLHYIVPSENGNRSDCSFVSFRDNSGSGFCFVTSDRDDAICPFNFSAQLHSMRELHVARHTSDLEARDDGKHPIHVNIDGKLMGLGGDNRLVLKALHPGHLSNFCIYSWFPVVYPEYLVSSKTEYSSCIWLLPLNDGEEAVDVVGANFSRYRTGGRAI